MNLLWFTVWLIKFFFSLIQYTLETAQKIYGCDTIQVALAHRALSKAMLAVQTFDDLAYYIHATEGVKIARSILPENHPMLYLFLHTSGKFLYQGLISGRSWVPNLNGSAQILESG